MRAWVTVAIAAILLAGCSKPAIIEYGEGFPAVQAENLSGDTVRIPEDLGGEANLIAIGYVREHQPAIDEWLTEAAPLLESEPRFAFYELPVIDTLNALQRTYIDTGMRMGIPDEMARARTVTVYTDVAEFNAALGVETTEVIRVFVIDADGRIFWRASDAPTPETAAAMRAAVERLLR